MMCEYRKSVGVGDKKIILFGAGNLGRRALNFFGPDRVHCFVDNNKTGQLAWGKRVISFDELLLIHHDYEVLLSVRAGVSKILEEQCNKGGIPCKMHADMISHEDYESKPDIRQFENKHKDKRCFLIGNGPSLRTDDLDQLHDRGEISFGCNDIYKAFDQTAWRPKYYMRTDFADIENKIEILANMDVEHKFFAETEEVYSGDSFVLRNVLGQSRGNVYYIHNIAVSRTDERPRFSPDASRALYGGGTVMYKMMQMAVYMGFVNIYLLGVDGTHSSDDEPGAYVAKHLHFYDDCVDEIARVRAFATRTTQQASEAMLANAYAQAEEYTREHGIKIYNATRGGILEAFERVDFDSLLRES